jgi:hypothetical protein
VLTLGSWIDAMRATLLLAAVAGVYWWRAKTEERHLGLDPDYIAYSEWMERRAPVPRFFGGCAVRHPGLDPGSNVRRACGPIIARELSLHDGPRLKAGVTKG